MNRTYDLVLKNGRVIDPVNRTDGVLDLAVSDGRIADIGGNLSAAQARECFDLQGLLVIPGIIDLHVHASAWLGGRYAHRMMALAGVTTALDMSGPVSGVLEMARDHGAGLSLACLEYVRPGDTVSGPDPDGAEVEALLHRALAGGAIGLKVLGGHYPLTPEATARVIEVGARNGAYIAVHAGTKNAQSNIDGFRQAVALAQGYPLHIAHVNSYCRGLVRSEIAETEEAIGLLATHPNICSESYLSPMNGTSAKCANGKPESQITRTCLERGGFDPTERGMQEAILAGWAQINMETGGTVALAGGKAALGYWRDRGTDTPVSFKMNPPVPRMRLATVKRPSGEFVVDTISTDGGGIPRNVIVSMGLSLVRLGALSLEEFVIKTSRNPAKILGLSAKGHLGPGADADITVLDAEKHRPVMGIGNGRMIMYRGYVVGKGVRFITTPAGEAAVRQSGVDPLVVDPANTPFCRR